MISLPINELYYKILRLLTRMNPVKPNFKVKFGEKYINVPLVTYIDNLKPHWKTELIGHFVELNSGDFIGLEHVVRFLQSDSSRQLYWF